jgi:NAD(P)-dependent dehydrogenase (short-subunit alcohol dehydrogenase family)
MALDHASQGIRVNAVCPGFIRTPMTAPLELHPGMYQMMKDSIPLGRGSQPEEVGKEVLWLASDEASLTTGTSKSPSILLVLSEGDC